MKLGVSLRAGLLAGVLAGIVLSIFSLGFTTPFIDKAIVLEHSLTEATPEPFSRNMMKFGMVVGFMLYGLMMGLLFAAVYAMVRGKLPVNKESHKGFILAFLAFWSMAFIPFLKYPANPPGVGGEDITFRQATYAGFLAISILLTAACVSFYKYMEKAKSWRWPLTILAYGVAITTVYLLMPPHPFPPTKLPANILWGFRTVSLIGMTLFWAALGINFVLLGRRLSIKT